MTALSKNEERLALSRLYSRFTFGPRPGEFKSALAIGLNRTTQNLLVKPETSELMGELVAPDVTDLGARPTAGTSENNDFQMRIRQQNRGLALWWLDQMVKSEFQLNEKMVWFWHGHWATSIEKVRYALPIYNQNQVLRSNALGDFQKMSELMFLDGALQIWLDGQENTAKAPNENLAREFMELFTLGVGNYTEEDVKALSRIFTGYLVARTSGVVTFAPRRHDFSAVTLLDRTASFTANQAIDLLVERDSCARFISERIWYRFFSESEPLPRNFDSSSFVDRDIYQLVSAFVKSSYLTQPNLAMAKSPVEWFVAICRAFQLTPSQFSNSGVILNHLGKLAQVPFMPPSVGGWPAGGAWLTSASAQFRLDFSQYVIKAMDLKELRMTPKRERINYLIDLLGIYQLSARTEQALVAASDDPGRLVLLIINSPEYVVGA